MSIKPRCDALRIGYNPLSLTGDDYDLDIHRYQLYLDQLKIDIWMNLVAGILADPPNNTFAESGYRGTDGSDRYGKKKLTGDDKTLTRMETCAAERSIQVCKLAAANSIPFVFYFPRPAKTIKQTPILDSLSELMSLPGVKTAFSPHACMIVHNYLEAINLDFPVTLGPSFVTAMKEALSAGRAKEMRRGDDLVDDEKVDALSTDTVDELPDMKPKLKFTVPLRPRLPQEREEYNRAALGGMRCPRRAVQRNPQLAEAGSALNDMLD